MNQKEILKNLLLLDHPELLEKVDISRTKTNKTVMSCEQELSKEFEKLFNLIIKNGISRLSAEQQFGKELREKIKHCIQKSYFAGLDYVTKVTKIPVNLTTDDVLTIENKTEEIYQAFFDKVDKINWKYEFLSNPMLIAQINALPQTVMFNMVQIATTQAVLSLNANGQISSKEVIFTTEQDASVCNFCYPYHDRIFQADDPAKPEIPIHPNCRCRYLIYSNEQRMPLIG
jgi:hypothetical protein